VERLEPAVIGITPLSAASNFKHDALLDTAL
jgi:hypothetical protein